MATIVTAFAVNFFLKLAVFFSFALDFAVAISVLMFVFRALSGPAVVLVVIRNRTKRQGYTCQHRSDDLIQVHEEFLAILAF